MNDRRDSDDSLMINLSFFSHESATRHSQRCGKSSRFVIDLVSFRIVRLTRWTVEFVDRNHNNATHNYHHGITVQYIPYQD